MRNLEANTISVEDVLHTLREFDLDSRFEGAFDHIVAFASELTGLSEDFLIDRMYEKQVIDFGRLSFRDFDDTALPVQFFFGYEVTKEQRDDLVSSLGYRTEDCMDFEYVLDVFELGHCPVEAVITFADGNVEWVDIADSSDDLDSFIQIIKGTDTERAREALKMFGDAERFGLATPDGLAPKARFGSINATVWHAGRAGEEKRLGDYAMEEKAKGERHINREKLAEYLAEEMILEFESPEECKVYFNTYDGQNFETVADMKKYQGEYGFGLEGKWYHISFDEALDVYKPASLEEQIAETTSLEKQNKVKGLVDRDIGKQEFKDVR